MSIRCLVLGHKWVRVGGVEGIVRCTKCGKEKEAMRPAGGGFGQGSPPGA